MFTASDRLLATLRDALNPQQAEDIDPSSDPADSLTGPVWVTKVA